MYLNQVEKKPHHPKGLNQISAQEFSMDFIKSKVLGINRVHNQYISKIDELKQKEEAEAENKINEESRQKSRPSSKPISINSIPNEPSLLFKKNYVEIKAKIRQELEMKFKEISEAKFNFNHELSKFERMNLEASFDSRILLYCKRKSKKINKVKRKYMSSMTLAQNQLKRGSTRRGSK